MIQSAEEFVRLRLSENADEYLRAARESAPDQVWMEVIERYPDMRIWVARNKPVSLTVLRVLSDDPDVSVRQAVAGRRKLDPDLFAKLSQDSEFAIRGELAGNKKAPEEILRVLAEDSNEWVSSVAEHRLGLTSRTEGDFVRIRIAANCFAYGRVLPWPLMAFYAFRSGEAPSTSELAETEILFRINVLDYALLAGRWEVIGNLPLDASLLDTPRFFMRNPDTKELEIDGIAATSDECADLEHGGFWETEHVEDRLRDAFVRAAEGSRR